MRIRESLAVLGVGADIAASAPAAAAVLPFTFAPVNPGSLLISTLQPDRTVMNGEFVGTVQFVSVPAPGFLPVLTAGLMGLGLAPRRRS